ncbi:hypothetical protein CEXT_61951 [Caerostris extrusa]|uniref:Uncharacterized protein n=1 Tax=Caerostris extrusa TaxID=172846 RepID=A0AAV4R8J0_CAEEX|nr:hypothetical protein CEXT_61951 [Caerostris extrusa]
MHCCTLSLQTVIFLKAFFSFPRKNKYRNSKRETHHLKTHPHTVPSILSCIPKQPPRNPPRKVRQPIPCPDTVSSIYWHSLPRPGLLPGLQLTQCPALFYPAVSFQTLPLARRSDSSFPTDSDLVDSFAWRRITQP